jgi:AraC-like DNA-binding protein
VSASKPIIRPTKLVYQTSAADLPGGVTLAGFLRHSRGVNESMRVFGRYAVVLVIDGEGVYRDTRGASQPIRIGDLIVVFPELGHWYGPGPGQTWSEFYVVFEGPVFDAWRSPALLDPGKPVLHLEPIDYWLGRMESIVDGGGDLEKVCRMQQFLADVLEHQRREPGRDAAWLSGAKALLNALVTDPPLRPEDAAAKIGMGYEAFRKRFTRLAGQPPAKYRDARLMDLASRLLHDRDRPLKQIADACGFCDEFHFSRRFKQKVGLSPSDFRARLA